MAREAGIDIVGGHTVKTDEPLYGLAVIGIVHPDRIVTNAGARAATDVTGFGLLGHLSNLLEASGVGTRVEARKAPLLDGVLEYAEKGFVCSGSFANRKQLGDRVSWGESVSKALQVVLCDAQTSGGLLIAVPPENEETLLADLDRRDDAIGVTIGTITKKGDALIEVV